MYLSINFFEMPTKASVRFIALWMMWAAGDMVNFVEFKEVMELPGSIAWAIVTFQYEWMSKLSKDHS